MTENEFRYVTYIATTPEKLWEALTSPEFTRQYWGGREVESDWRVGSPVAYRYDGGTKLDLSGEILQADPPKLLSYSFAGERERNGEEQPSRVTFELRPMQSVVQLTVTHDEFAPGSKTLRNISSGWPGILSNLKTLLETGKPMPYEWKG